MIKYTYIKIGGLHMDNKRILIVEDDFDLSKIIKDFLTNENYNIKQAFKGNEALELV